MMGFRLATMVQMIGAIALGWDFWGVHPLHRRGQHHRPRSRSEGFLVMRVGIIFLWLRGSAEPVRTRTGSSDCATTRAWLRTRAREGLPATPDNAD